MYQHINDQVCQHCQGTSLEILDSYMNHWIQCNDCLNVFRRGKETFPLDDLIKQPFYNKLYKSLPKRLKKTVQPFLSSTHKFEDKSTWYDYYSKSLEQDYKATKWKKYDDEFLNFLETIDIDLQGKDILAISEGPGFIVNRLRNRVNSIALTEVSQHAADTMAHMLKVDSYAYDFNKDDIQQIVKHKKFDQIWLRSCIAFCNDIDRLAGSLRKILKNESIVYIKFHAPSRLNCLHWMFNIVTTNVWYNPETIVRAFEKNGFELLYPYTRYRQEEPIRLLPRQHWLNTMIVRYYQKLAEKKNKYFTREDRSVYYLCTFRLKQS